MATQAQANSFAADPRSFMRTAIVRFCGGAPQDQANITVAMETEGTTGRARSWGRKVDVSKFTLRDQQQGHALPGAATFPAVWSGYVGGQARTATRPAAGGPGIMLTPELTGCAVVCHHNADGSANFSHYNILAANNPQTEDRATMAAIARAEYGGGEVVFAKEEYRALGKHSQNIRVTVVGIRRASGWEFWAQVREDKPSGQQLREVRRLA